MNAEKTVGAFGRSLPDTLQHPLVMLVCCLALAAFVLWTASPAVNPIPSRDSSVFLYVGERILDGELPYRDVWDHKPPVVFLLNAGGLVLAGGSFWGVWLVELLSLTLAAFLALKLLREYFGLLPAAITVLAGVVSLSFVIKRGNFTEEYALPFQLAGIYWFFQVDRARGLKWQSLWIGLALGVVFLLKQNLIGVWVVIAATLALQGLFGRKWPALGNLLIVLFGAAAVFGIAAGIFALTGAFAQYWDAAFLYNFAYSAIPDALRLSGLVRLLGLVALKSPFFLLAAPAWLLTGLALVFFDRQLLAAIRSRWTGGMLLFLSLVYAVAFPIFRSQTPILWGWPVWLRYLLAGLPYAGILVSAGIFTGVWDRFVFAPLSRLPNPLAGKPYFPVLRFAWLLLPVELLLLAYSGRTYFHYAMVLMPALLLLAAIGVEVVFTRTACLGKKANLIAVAAALVLLGASGFVETIRLSRPATDAQRTLAIEFVRSHTTEDEMVLMWGAETVVNLMSGRPAPTRFVYQYPLYTRGYSQPALFEELLADLEQNPPKLIVDTVNGYTPFVDQPNQVVYSDVYEVHPAGVDIIFNFVRANYRIIEDHLGDEKWVVYEYQPGIIQFNPSN